MLINYYFTLDFNRGEGVNKLLLYIGFYHTDFPQCYYGMYVQIGGRLIFGTACRQDYIFGTACRQNYTLVFL